MPRFRLRCRDGLLRLRRVLSLCVVCPWSDFYSASHVPIDPIDPIRSALGSPCAYSSLSVQVRGAGAARGCPHPRQVPGAGRLGLWRLHPQQVCVPPRPPAARSPAGYAEQRALLAGPLCGARAGQAATAGPAPGRSQSARRPPGRPSLEQLLLLGSGLGPSLLLELDSGSRLWALLGGGGPRLRSWLRP